MNLYLASFVLVETRYMDPQRYLSGTQYRLVKASNIAAAGAKILQAFNVDDPYGRSVDVEGLEIHETIE
jgi:hypothetical protein